MRLWITVALLCAIAFAPVVQARAAIALSGVVIDAASGIGIAGARVRVVANAATYAALIGTSATEQ